MKSVELNGQWKMRDIKKEEWIDAHVPGSVFLDLLNAGKAPDPYYRDNEDKIAPLFREDYEYSREFSVDGEVLRHNKVILCCEGLDTIAKITLNGREIANTNNMHRTYRFDVKKLLKKGTNTIHIVFFSPVAFVEKKASENKGMSLTSRGIEHLRKAQCMFGWDWGLVLPDSGIWRDIYIECFDEGKIEDVQILQEHEQGKVNLNITSSCKIWGDKSFELRVEITSPDGKKSSAAGHVDAGSGEYVAVITIPDPQLWWPNGFGEQPLYQLEVLLKDGRKLLDSRQLQIGLRTIRLRQEEDEWGKSYEFVVNGKALFIKGSNLIIEDAILARCSREKTEKMIKSCVDANFNCIRVWGGANYPSDYFYEFCDKYGLILYHDIMFACNFYPADTEFLENVKCEVADNVKRARHHACIGLWCGNNEIEVIFGTYVNKAPELIAFRKQLGVPEIEERLQQKLKADYLKLFYEVLPELLLKLDPDTCFVNSSPSSDEPCTGTFFTGYDRADAHYYLAADMLSPYSKIRSFNFRFVSEIGFQSYPCVKTINAFTLPEDRKPDSAIMLKHQKYRDGNPVIEAYMNRDYKTPKNFECYVYTSQIMAGEILKYTVEHLRRNEGRTMGILTWQLNDCWPAVSWAGIDYNGRWKAQQYYSKRSYEPILISALEDGTAMDIWVTNDTPKDVQGSFIWKLLNNNSEIIEQGSGNLKANQCKSQKAVHLDFSSKINEANKGDFYVEFAFNVGNRIVSRNTTLFVKPKDFNFIDPEIKLYIEENESSFFIAVKSSAFAKSVALELSEADCIFSDNYMDVSAGDAKKIEVAKSSISEKLTVEEFSRQLHVMSVYEIGQTK
jgi:beta-mannosidase